MNRLLVALLATLDAVLAAAGGIAVALAPLTLLWVVGLGTAADWAALWPASASVWQLGHLVPLAVQLPEQYLATAGIDPAAAAFNVSLAPLGFALFTALFAARSGGRAALAGAPVTGVVAGSLVFTAAAAVVAVTSGNAVVSAEPWQAILLPALVFAVPCLLGAVVRGWNARIDPIARLRTIAEQWHGAWSAVPGVIVRGTAIATLGLVGVAAIVFAVALFVRGGQVVALFQAANVDPIGATLFALGQLLYLPTLVVWSLSFVAGPGFALGTDTAVSPSGTQLGVVPGIPALGAIPDSTSSWLLVLALLPVAVGALTGWMLRSRLVADVGPRSAAALGPRLAIAGGVSVLPAAIVALLAAVSAGAFGPGRLAQLGPEPGPVALAVGLELAVGLSILMLLPARADHGEHRDREAFETGSSTEGMSWRTLSAPHLYEHDHDDIAPVAVDSRGPSDDASARDAHAPVAVGRHEVAPDELADDEAEDGRSEDHPASSDEHATAPIEPLDLPVGSGAPPRVDDASPAEEQPTEPIIDFQRGSGGGGRPPGERPGGSAGGSAGGSVD